MSRDNSGFQLYRRGELWYAKFIGNNGLQKRISTRVPAKEEFKSQAKLVANRIILDEYKDFHPEKVVKKTVTLGSLLLTVQKHKDVGEADINCFIQISKILPASFRMNDFSSVDVTNFITTAKQPYADKQGRERSRSDATVLRLLASLSSCINFANESLEMGLPNPITGRLKALRSKAQKQKKEKIVLTLDSFKVLLKTAETMDCSSPLYNRFDLTPLTDYMPDVIRLLWGTLFRIREITNLTWDRVDYDRMELILNPSDHKSGDYRRVPISEVAAAVLERRRAYMQKNNIKSRYIICNKRGEKIDYPKKSFAKIAKAAGFTGLTPHCIRHSGATYLLNSGMDIRLISEILRHSDLKTTEFYTRFYTSTLAKGMQSLNVLD